MKLSSFCCAVPNWNCLSSVTSSSFRTCRAAFRAFAAAYPDDCILLVDTIDTLNSGLPNAIAIFEELRAGGHEPRGIRLDSGDLAYLAIRAAGMLDAAGFSSTSIVLSSELDELAIWQINTQIETEAPRYGVDGAALLDRLIYGVGTRLITSDGHSALGGVYKLVAVNDGSAWQAAIKISDSPEKITTNVLTDRLSQMERAGLIKKRPYQLRPKRFEYTLTRKGQARQVALIGIDTASIDYGKSQDFLAHRAGAAEGVANLENLTNLGELPVTGAYVIALPMKIEGGSGGPARVIALVPR